MKKALLTSKNKKHGVRFLTILLSLLLILSFPSPFRITKAEDEADPPVIIDDGAPLLAAPAAVPTLTLSGVPTADTVNVGDSCIVTAAVTGLDDATDITYTWSATTGAKATAVTDSPEKAVVEFNSAASSASVTCTVDYKIDGADQTALTQSFTKEIKFNGTVPSEGYRQYNLVTTKPTQNLSNYIIVYSNNNIVQPTVSNNALVTNKRIDTGYNAGNSTIRISGAHTEYEWSFTYNSSGNRYTFSSGSNNLHFNTNSSGAKNYNAAMQTSGSRIRMTFDGNIVHFTYNNTGSTYSNRVTYNSDRSGITGGSSSASNINFYLYKYDSVNSKAPVTADPTAQIQSLDGTVLTGSQTYYKNGSATFKAGTKDIDDIKSYSWRVTGTNSSSCVTIVDANTAMPTILFNDGTTSALNLELTVTYGNDQTKTATLPFTIRDVTPGAKITSGSFDVTGKTQDKLDITPGSTEQLSADISNIGTQGLQITWSSDSPSVATVSNNGLVTFTGNKGYATITMTVNGTDLAGKAVNISKTTRFYVDIDPIVEIHKGVRNITGILQRRYEIEAGQTENLDEFVSNMEDVTSVVWASSDTSIATIDQTGKITFTGAKGYTNISLTVIGTNLKGEDVQVTKYVTYYTDTAAQSAPDEDYPVYPEQGSIKINKYAKGVDFPTTGVAKVSLELEGIPFTKPIDVVIVVDMSSSMTDSVGGHDRVGIMRDSLKNLADNLLAENPDGTPSQNRLCIIGFNNYDHALIASDLWVSGTTSENKSGYNHLSTGKNPVILDWSTYNQINTIKNTIQNQIVASNCTPGGTNYDLGLYEAYTKLALARQEEGYDRDQVVLFLSDGCAFQYNYSRGRSGDTANEGYRMMTWLSGDYNRTDSTTLYQLYGAARGKSPNNNTVQTLNRNNLLNARQTLYYSDQGLNWWAEAIKSNSGSNRVIIPYVSTSVNSNNTSGYVSPLLTGSSPLAVHDSSTTDANVFFVDGLGVTIYSLGFCLDDDKEITTQCTLDCLTRVSTPGTTLYTANDAEELENAFTDFVVSIKNAATQTIVTDIVGTDYVLQFAPDKTVNVGKSTEAVVHLNDGDYIGENPYIEVVLQTVDDTDRVTGETSVEKVTFATDSNGDLTAAYSNKKGSSLNIYNFTDNKIYAEYFTYDIPNKTFSWNIGTVTDHVRYQLNYFVYLTGACEGTRDAGAYPTNQSAKVDYVNYLGHQAQKIYPIPYMPWEAAMITYEVYYVNDNGVPINERNSPVEFKNRVTYFTGTKVINLNSQDTVNSMEIIAAEAIPEGYELYNASTSYFVNIGSGSWESYAYVYDNGMHNERVTTQTTFGYDPSTNDKYQHVTVSKPIEGTTYNYQVNGITDYTNTHVAFAVTKKPTLREISVEKVWVDAGHTDERTTSVTVQLLEDGMVKYGRQPIVLNAENDWTYTWENLNKYVYDNGIETTTEIVYTVQEVNVPTNFKAIVSDPDGNGHIILTNKYDNYYSIKVTKTDDAIEDKSTLAGAGFRLYTDALCTTEVEDYYLDEDLQNKVSDLEDEDIATGSDGVITFYGLAPGTYYLKEFRSPTGFQRLHTALTVIIDNDGTASVITDNNSDPIEVTVEERTVKFSLANRKLDVDIPFTAGVGIYGFLFTGITMMLFACVLLVIIRRRGQKTI